MTKDPYGSSKRLLGTERYMPDFSNRQRKKAHGARKKTPISAVNPNYQVISQIEVDGLKWANKVADTLKKLDSFSSTVGKVGDALTALQAIMAVMEDVNDADRKLSRKSATAVTKAVSTIATSYVAGKTIALIAPALVAGGPPGWLALAGIGLLAIFVTGQSDGFIEELIDNWNEYEFDESRIK